jgi:cytochrome o ubiquinol oxidase subunit 1
VNAVFGIASMIIAIPTGVKIFNWLFTMYGGSVRFTSPMLWAIGFMVSFVVGGMTGVLVAMPAADFQLHNSVFLVAHFHNVIIAGVVFAVFAGTTYWFPKAFGFVLDERLGKLAFWLWLIGFWVAWGPGYATGLEGMTRRLQHYDVAEWRPWLLVAAGGVVIILLGILAQVAQLVVSIRTREERRDVTGDPWDARNLEWATASPPPPFNFAVLPNVADQEPYWDMKLLARQSGHLLTPEPHYEPIPMPRNSPTGFVTAFFSVVTGFSLIWHIWWLVILGLAGAYATFVVFAWRDHDELLVPAEEVARLDRANRAARSAALQREPVT